MIGNVSCKHARFYCALTALELLWSSSLLYPSRTSLNYVPPITYAAEISSKHTDDVHIQSRFGCWIILPWPCKYCCAGSLSLPELHHNSKAHLLKVAQGFVHPVSGMTFVQGLGLALLAPGRAEEKLRTFPAEACTLGHIDWSTVKSPLMCYTDL